MRILQLAPPWFSVPPTGYGGIEQVVSCLADGLTARGQDVTLLASGGSHTAAELWSVFDTPPSEHLGSVPHLLPHVLAAYRNRGQFDIIHDHSGIIGPALGSLLDGPPVAHTLHGPWEAAIADVYAAVSDRIHLVAISHDQAARAPAGVRIAATVHNGIAVEAFPFRVAARGNAGYLAFVGRASPEKGPDIAIRVAARLRRPLRMAVKINEPSEHRYWQRHVSPLLDRADVEVVVNGTAQQAVGLLAGADATLFPIQWPEPFGLVMTEAMACGTPVVAFACGAAPEVIADGQTGFLVEPGDLEGMCDAVEQVDAIEPAACRRRVEQRFSASAMTAGYEQLFEQLVSQPSGKTQATRVVPLSGSNGPWSPRTASAGAATRQAQTVGLRRQR